MKYEPPIDHQQLIQAVRSDYGLPAEELTFVPVGYVAACYAVSCAGGGRYFLKLWPRMLVGGEEATELDRSLRLTRALHDRGLYARLPYPISTSDGSLSASFAESPYALFPFLPGHVAPPWPELSWPVREAFAQALAAIHRATPSLADVLPPRETFDFRDEAALRAGLSGVERIAPNARPGLLALRELVLPRQAEIVTQLDRLHQLQDAVRRLNGPMVLCHTDMGGDNLLVDGDQISVLDWDDAKLAPPEHDLQAALSEGGDGFERFLDVYLQAGGVAPWSIDHFAFYLLRRHLGDLTARFHHLLTEATSGEEDQHLLDGMKTWGFAKWRALDETLNAIGLALQHDRQ